jgi:hypothetical protein
MPSNIPVKEIGELFDEISIKLPKVFNGLMDTLYSAEAAKRMGQAVGAFYKELIQSGIPAEEAIKMAKEYMLSIKGLANSFGINPKTYEKP